MKCPKCKTRLSKSARFCPVCGAKAKRRKKRLVPVLLAIILLLGAILGGLIFLIPTATGSIPKINNVNEAIAHAKKLGEELGYENAMSEMTEKVTTEIDGDCYYRLQQNYQGIPVYGRTIVYSTDENGEVSSITGNILDVGGDVEIKPTLTYTQAIAFANSYFQSNFGIDSICKNLSAEKNEENLYIYSTTEKAKLVYSIITGAYEILIGANSAEIVSIKQTLNVSSINTNKSAGASNYTWKNSDGTYVLRDFERNIYIYDAAGNTYWDIYKNTIDPSVLTLVTSKDHIFGNEDDSTTTTSTAISFLKALSYAYDYFKSSFSETGCGALVGIYNDLQGDYNGGNAGGGLEFVEEAIPMPIPDYNRSDHNGQIGAVILGTEYSGDLNNMESIIDLIGHEYTHYISDKYIDWTHSEIINWEKKELTESNCENGAIREALSDIFGELIEFELHRETDWTHGDRAIYNPSENGYPKSAMHEVVRNNRGWVVLGENSTDYSHGFSTVISHAAYLMWNGIDGDSTQKIDAEKLAKLWYRAMLMMPSDCDFATCRQMVEWAALSVDGLKEAQRECISDAFDEVGIQDQTMSPEILINCDRNIRPGSKLNVYNIKGSLHSSYTLSISGTCAEHELAYAPTVLTDIGFRYEKTIEVTKATSYRLDLPDGYYTFTITDSNNPRYTYSFTVSISDLGTDDSIELHTDFENKLLVKITDPPVSDVYEKYMAAARKTTESGSWSEHLSIIADMAITNGSAKTQTKMTMTSDADVSNYSESDPSNVSMSGSAEMSVMGQTYAWHMRYEDGVAHYQYTQPNQTSADMVIDPSFFNFGTMTSDMMSNAQISGNQITFTVPGDKITGAGIAAVNQMSGVDDIKYGDVDVAVTISDEGTIDAITMTFRASLQYQGYDADMDYDIAYRFSSSASDLNASDTLSEINAYDDILYMYYNGISCNWSNCDGEGINNVGDPDNACYIFSRYEKNRSLNEVGYALFDINNDKQPELFISLPDIADSGSFYDMYTISDGEIIHVITAGERNKYNLAEDFSINNNGSSSAATGAYANYRLDNANGKLNVNYFIDYDYNREPQYFYTTTGYLNDETYEITSADLEPISNEEASVMLDRFPNNAPISLIPFSEYKSSHSLIADSFSAIERAMVASGDCGEKLTWTLDSNGTLTISGSGDMFDYPVGDDNPPWLDSEIEVQRIVFEGNITSIGENAFCNTSIRYITIPSSVKAIEYGALDYIDTLEGIFVEAGNTIYSNDDSGVLFTKDKTSLIVAPTKLSGAYTVPVTVTRICDNAFSECAGITTISWPASVATIGSGAFYGCSGLTHISIPSSVTCIEHYTFNECSGLKSIWIPKSVTSVGFMAFGNCYRLEDVYYQGSDEQWEQIKNSCTDTWLLNANLHAESE